MEDAEEELHADLPVEDYDTFGGFVFGIYGTIPSDGTQFEVTANGLQIKVLSIKEHRLQHALVQKQKNSNTEQPENEAKNHDEI